MLQAQQLKCMVSDSTHWPESPDALVTTGQQTLVRSDKLCASRHQRFYIGHGGEVAPHTAVHRWGQQNLGFAPQSQRNTAKGIVSQAVSQLGYSAGRRQTRWI